MKQYTSTKVPIEKVLQFRINPQSADIRTSFYTSMIKEALFDNDRPLDVNAINRKLNTEYSLPEFPTEILQMHIDMLVNNSELQQKPEGYRLTPESSKSLGIMKETRREQYRRLLEELKGQFKKVSKPGVTISPDQLQNMFLKFLEGLFISDSQVVANYLSSLNPNMKFSGVINEAKGFDNALQSAIIGIKDDDTKQAVRETIKNTLVVVSHDISDLLYTSMQNYIYFSCAGLDPECKLYEKQSIEDITVYLDTNIAIDLMFASMSEHRASWEMVALCIALGTHVKITQETVKETKEVISYHQSAFARLGDEQLIRYAKLDDSGILQTFLHVKEERPGYTFDSYCMEKIKDLEKCRFGDLKITIDNDAYQEIYKHKDLTLFKNLVSQAAKSRSRPKPKSAIQHDAFHLLLMHEKRKNVKEGIFGPKFWFVTRDRSLFTVSALLIGQQYTDYQLSCYSRIWLETLGIFFSMTEQKDANPADAFVNFAASRLATGLQEISLTRLIKIFSPWLPYHKFEPDELVELGKEVYKRFLSEKEKTLEEVANEYMVKVLSERVKNANDEKRGLEDEIEMLKSKPIEDQQETPKLILPIFISGICALGGLFGLAIFAAVNNVNINSAVYYALGTIGAAALPTSIFARKVFHKTSQ